MAQDGRRDHLLAAYDPRTAVFHLHPAAHQQRVREGPKGLGQVNRLRVPHVVEEDAFNIEEPGRGGLRIRSRRAWGGAGRE